jgi:hypothetical protein
MKKKGNNKINVEITEMFMAQADKDRCFYGCIKRLKDDNGKPFVFSRIVMPDGLLCARADDQNELSKNLDEMCILIMDNGLHAQKAISIRIFDS